MEWAWMNGEYLPLSEAKVPVEDRGYTFADGVYEVIKFVRGQPFLVERHLARLQRSAAELEIPLPSLQGLAQVMRELVERNQVPDGGIYLQVTRGVGRRQHTYPHPLQPTVLMLARNLPFVSAAERNSGVGVITLPDERWGRCDIKSISLLPNVLAREKARRAGAFEAVLVRDGIVTEASAHNLFAMFGDLLFTHPAGPRILSGITRGRVLEIARAEGLAVKEEPFRADQLPDAAELFLTGTGDLILPVVVLNGLPVGRGEPGRLTCLLRDSLVREAGL